MYCNIQLIKYMDNYRKNLSSPYFIALFVIVTLTIFFLILGNFRKYNSEISIIVIPKSQALASQSESLIQNFENFPKTLSFYNRLLSDNPEIKDEFLGLSDKERKEAWNKNLKVEREKGSQVLHIAISTKSNNASKMARQIASTLFSVSAQYYNLKTDLDLRIIDGPISSNRLNLWYMPALISLVLGFVLAFLVNYILTGLEKIFSKTKNNNLFQNISEKFKFEKNSKLTLEDFGLTDLGKSKPKEEKEEVKSRPSEELLKETDIQLKEKTKQDKKDIEDIKEIENPVGFIAENYIEAKNEKPRSMEKTKSDEFVKKGSAPANLPVAPANLPIASTEKSEKTNSFSTIKPHTFPPFGDEKIAPQEEKPEAKKGEPTEEEMKKRLNKLLKGEL